jgi:sarcosine oxidase subunit alpha
VKGIRGVTGVQLCAQAGEGAVTDEIVCEAVAMSGGWSPAVHLWSHCGGKLTWDEAGAFFRPDPDRPADQPDGEGFVACAGASDGALHASEVWKTLARRGADALESSGKSGSGAVPQADAADEAPLAPVWIMPQGAGTKKRNAKMWLDFQNDVKVSDVQLAAREGYESVEHTKRYTTLGMATDQGKLSNINGLAVLADALNSEIPQVGTTTFRPPFTPISMGAIAGEARGEVFQPLRRTPMHAWHEERRDMGARGPLAPALLLPEGAAKANARR